MTENQPLDNAAEEMPTAQISSETSNAATAETSVEVAVDTNEETMSADAAAVATSGTT